MNSASLDRFSRVAAKAAVKLRGSRVTIGEVTCEAAVFHGSETVENDRGGKSVIRTMVVHVDRHLLSAEPAVGTRITDLETGVTGEIYEIGGRGLPKYILRAASHPDKSA